MHAQGPTSHLHDRAARYSLRVKPIGDGCAAGCDSATYLPNISLAQRGTAHQSAHAHARTNEHAVLPLPLRVIFVQLLLLCDTRPRSRCRHCRLRPSRSWRALRIRARSSTFTTSGCSCRLSGISGPLSRISGPLSGICGPAAGSGGAADSGRGRRSGGRSAPFH